MAALRATLVLLLLTGARAATVGDLRVREPSTAPASGLRDLTTGRYELALTGVLCSACLRAAAREMAAAPAVASAQADIAHQRLIIAIKPGRTLTVRALRRSLARASRRVNLGTRLDVAAVYYSLTPVEPDLSRAPGD